jgi:DNA-binding winged helix-turn-helix (wHTH) protein
MSNAALLEFDDFVLDEDNALLTRAGAPVALPPKAFTLLCVLARQAGKLASKDALLDAVWGHRHVSESVLKTTIAQVRAALADDAGEPRYIETVARRGYRFIGRSGAAAPVAAAPLTRPLGSPPAAAPTPASVPSIVGRSDALAHLQGAWRKARAGQRQLVWIAGEAGIGKTTLIERFAAEVGAERYTHGQCVEQFGAGEPYLPVLEALKTLAKRDPGVVQLMRQVAPMWLLQMPWLVADADRGTLHAALVGAGQDRMVRELWELLERYTDEQPLLLITEDLHWSDQGTLRLMEHFARRRGTLRLLWIASFRLTQVIAEEHPLQRVRQELQLHRLCDELLLDPFSEGDVAAYLAARAPGSDLSEEFVRTLHAHTDGLPLFVASVCESLASQGALGAVSRQDRIGALPVPDNLVGAIEKQLAKLPPPARAVLEAASVCGMDFRATTVAELLATGAADVMDICDDFVRRQYWLREGGIVDRSDGALDAQYTFRHAVYKHVFYNRLAATQRIALHRRAARALEQSAAVGLAPTAAELASHYELGREYRAALVNYAAAAENALGHYAPQEALRLADQALALLPSCAAVERPELELTLQAARGIAFGALRGIAADETTRTFDRVAELVDALPPSPARALLLNSAGWGLFTRCRYAGALELADRIQAVGESFDDRVLQAFAANLKGVTLANLGRPRESRDSLLAGLAAYEQVRDRLRLAQLYVDPEASMCANVATVLLQLGLVDQARAMAARAEARGALVRQPLARLVAQWCKCLVGTRLEDVDAVDAGASELEKLVAETQLHQARAPALWFRGWVEIKRGRPLAGLALVREGYAFYAGAGTMAGASETLSYVVEAFIWEQRWDEALAALADADAIAARFGERLMVPKLRLLEARIAAARGDRSTARRALEAALHEARSTGALFSELRIALAPVAEWSDRTPSDVEALRAAYARMTEGLDTVICTRARAALAAAAG